jgi:hypothetical protein
MPNAWDEAKAELKEDLTHLYHKGRKISNQ